MQERHVADSFVDPLIKAIISDADLWDLVISGIRPVVREVILPQAGQMAKAEHIFQDVRDAMKDAGFYGMSIPEQYGGLGKGETGDCLLIYEIGYGDLSVSLLPLVSTSLFGRCVQVGGTEEQKQRILPKVASGKIFGCYGLTESGGSSFRESIQTRAEKKGDVYVLNGQKIFITEAEEANMCVVIAKIDGTDGIGAFLVPNFNHAPEGYKNSNGYVCVSKEKGKPGIHASATCSISLENVEVPEEDLLGLDFEGKQGLGIAVKSLGYSRPTIAAQALGAAKRALAYTMQYALETPRGDGSTQLLDRELYRVRLAELTGYLTQATSYLFSVARVVDQGDVTRDDVLMVYSSMLKRNATDIALEIAKQSMGMLGGAGYSGEHPVGRIWTDLGVPSIYEGHNDLQSLHAGKFVVSELRKGY